MEFVDLNLSPRGLADVDLGKSIRSETEPEIVENVLSVNMCRRQG